MTGVQIIGEEFHSSFAISDIAGIGIILVVVVCAMHYVTYLDVTNARKAGRKANKWMTVFIPLVVDLLVLGMISYAIYDHLHPDIRYFVMADDNVNWIEFNDTYCVIEEFPGSIYLVEERTGRRIIK